MLDDAELIIFDCDGVLVDTEPLTNRLLAEVITEAGWPVTTEDSIRMFKGHDLNEIVLEVERRVGRSLPDLLPEYRARMFASFEAGIDPVVGAVEVLDTLDALGGPRRCVASNGPQNKMHASLTAAGLIDRFDHDGARRLYSAYDVGVWKPEPDLFLHAAGDMGTAVDRCIVIEDSVTGIRAAVSAGMRVIGLAGLTPARDLAASGATTVISSMHELVAALG